jgi:nucleoside phosphorylase
MPTIDFAILTGLTEEFVVLKKIFPDFKELSENGLIWYRTRVVATNDRNYEIVAAFQNDMGPLEAQDLMAKVNSRWDPAYVILVGVAGTFQKEVKLGDVIVSQQIFYYDPGKVTTAGIEYRPQGYPCSTVLIRQAEALRLDGEVFDAWQKTAKDRASKFAQESQNKFKNRWNRKKIQEQLINHEPNIHFGTIASGSLVIAARKKRKELLKLHGKVIGTEMEGAGVLHASFHMELPLASFYD